MPDPSRRELIVRAVISALGVSGKPSGLNVHRFRARAIERDALPAMVVFTVTDPAELDNLEGAAEHRLLLRVECRTSGDPPDQELDPLYLWAVQAIMADPTLGGLAEDTNERVSAWEAVQSDRVYGALAVDFEIDYLTDRADPAALPGG